MNETHQLRDALRALPRPRTPDGLTTQLRVLASKERARRRIRNSTGERLRELASRAALVADNLMRPFAVPAMGGVAMSLVIFSLIAAYYPAPAAASSAQWDVPTMLYTEAAFKNMGPILLDTEEVVVDLTINEAGRVLTCDLADGGVPIQHAGRLKREVENALLYAEFTPATSFGQPIPGRVRIAFRRGVIEVKG